MKGVYPIGNLTKNLSRYEFACKCGCGFDTVDFETINYIQGAADHFVDHCSASKAIVTITSGCRCPVHNKAEGGSDDSEHIQARATDHVIEVVVSGVRILVDEDELADYYDNEGVPGVGRYPGGRVHIDSGTGSHRPYSWDSR